MYAGNARVPTGGGGGAVGRLVRPAQGDVRLPAPRRRLARQSRETYDRGNGATILLYDPAPGTVLLTRQFRWPAYVNGHPDGMLIETPAGLLDDEDPEAAIRREAEEETGVRVGEVEHALRRVHEPGLGDRAPALLRGAVRRAGAGRAAAAWPRKARTSRCSRSPLAEALAMIGDGEIADAKTIMLLQWAERHGVVG